MYARLGRSTAAILYLALLAVSCAGSVPVHVARVVDGDTVVLEDGRRVRLAGVDAPETGREAEAGGEEARLAVERLLGAGSGVVELEARGRDRFGRVLGRLLLPGGRDLGAVLVRTGRAEVFFHAPPDLVSAYLPLEIEARRAGRGIWNDLPVLAPRQASIRSTGTLLCVEGRVDRVRRVKGHRFLDFLQEGTEMLTVAVFSDQRETFPEDPASWTGRLVRVTGRLRAGPRGHPEIALWDPSRVEFPADPARAGESR